MDNLSKELEDFLIRLGKDENGVGERLAGYTHQLLNLLYSSDAKIVEERYGLFGEQPHTPDELATRYHTTPDAINKGIAMCLRKIAVTPEWQTMKPMTKLRAIKLK